MTQQEEITKARSRVTTNTPALSNDTPPFLNVLIEMEKNARSQYTINFTYKALSLLARHCNLEDPEQVKTFVTKINASNGYKRNLCIAYNNFCKYYKIQWNMPTYHPEPKAIKIPTKEKIEMLIASAKRPTSIKCKSAKKQDYDLSSYAT